ncbi:acylneuraminate cytidylyltransferase family protein [Candidatus Kaiserbacteria bacterium]|nr:acylneuraminate cytidylyltransferase family protein [Candidatus Kaiserbacteria bacterium]
MSEKPEILAIIPARAGSKTVPGKNIKPIAGKPLIEWTIEAAKGSKHLTRVIVSTDDEEIAEVARKAGAEVPFMRPGDISQDLSTDVEFLTHALDVLKAAEGYEPDIVVRLPPTSPLRTGAHIDEGIEKLLSDDSLDAVRPIHESPKHPYKLWKLSDNEMNLEPFLSRSFTGHDEPYNLPRQLFPKVYVHTGAMDVMRRDTILKQESTSGRKLGYFFMRPEDSVNIDTLLDFEIAEILLKRRMHG